MWLCIFNNNLHRTRWFQKFLSNTAQLSGTVEYTDCASIHYKSCQSLSWLPIPVTWLTWPDPCYWYHDQPKNVPSTGLVLPASVLGMTLNYLIVSFPSWSFEKYVVLYHYSQVYSNLEWEYLIGSHLWVK